MKRTKTGKFRKGTSGNLAGSPKLGQVLRRWRVTLAGQECECTLRIRVIGGSLPDVLTDVIAADSQPELLTILEVAKILGLGHGRVYQLIARGLLPFVSLGSRQMRVDAAVLRGWVANGGARSGGLAGAT